LQAELGQHRFGKLNGASTTVVSTTSAQGSPSRPAPSAGHRQERSTVASAPLVSLSKSNASSTLTSDPAIHGSSVGVGESTSAVRLLNQLGGQPTAALDANRASSSSGSVPATNAGRARLSHEGTRPNKKPKHTDQKPDRPKPGGGSIGARDSQAPTVTINQNPVYGVEWQAVLVSGYFHDQGDTGAHTLTINWGDGQSQQQYYSFLPPMGQGFGFQHTYEDDAVYTVTVTVVDVANNVGQAQVAANIGTVEKVEWIAMDSPLDGNPKEGGGLRIYPDKVTPNDMLNRQKVKVRATLTQPAVGVTIWVQYRDVDDPSSNEGPVDVETMPADNRGGASMMGTGQTFLLDGKAVAEYELTVGMQPGDNYRAVATVKEGALNTVSAKQNDTDKARVFDDVTNLPLPSDKVKVTEQLLTVWRRLHVEVDSMGAPPEGTQFDDDDLLTGDVPDPDISGYADAFSSAYVTSVRDTGHDNPSMPWRYNFQTIGGSPDGAALWSYFIGGPNPQRGTRNQEQPLYWVAYVASIHEFTSANDNDPDDGHALPATTVGNEPEFSIVMEEVARDVAAQWQWTPFQTANFRRVLALHEVGHQFELEHSLPDANGFPMDVMWVPTEDSLEDRARNQPLSFSLIHLAEIRSIDYP
jgi:hypothetical protein